MLDPVELALTQSTMKSLSTMNDALHVVQRDWLEKLDKVQPFVDYEGNFQEDVQVCKAANVDCRMSLVLLI
jgi:hypothetical protein